MVVFRWPPRGIIFFGIFPRSRCDGFLQRGGWSGQVFRETSFECQLLSAFVTDDLLLSILGSTFFFHFHSVHIDENIAWFTSLITIQPFQVLDPDPEKPSKKPGASTVRVTPESRVLHMCWTSLLLTGAGILGSLDSCSDDGFQVVKLRRKLRSASEKHVIHPFLFGGQGSLFQMDPNNQKMIKKSKHKFGDSLVTNELFRNERFEDNSSQKTKAPFKTSNRAGQTSQSHGSDRASNKVDRGEAWLIRDGAGYNMIP